MKTQPHILMILENGSFPEDTRVRQEAVALVEAGFNVTVVCPTGELSSKHDVVNGVRVYRYPKPVELPGVFGYAVEFGYSLLIAFVYSWFVFIRHGFDALHVHCPPDMNSLLGIFWKLAGKRFVVDLHDLSPELYDARSKGEGGAVLKRILLFFERLACRAGTRLIATNQTQQEVQINRGGASREHCYVVRNGPNERFNPNVPSIPELSQDPRQKIGYVGMIGIQDGVDSMVEALNHLRYQLNGTDFLGVIVGAGPAFESLKQLATERRLDDCLLFTGMVKFEDVPAYIASFDICVTPDPSNAYNDSCTTIKTMEYMALAKPTVSFDTRENRLTAGEAALFADNNDAGQLASQIATLMDDPDLRRKLGQEGRRRIEQLLSWDRQKGNLTRLYEELFHQA